MMSSRRWRAVVVGLSFSWVAGMAQAQATRTWVSGVGDDANPCSRTAPCKTFAGAISKTAAGGEISALDPGGFGAVTITKSITINGDGTLAGILASLTNGVIVNAGAADKVVLRNISINGAGNGINGIRYLAGEQLTVENCSISGFTTRGIDMALGATGNLFVTDTNITRVPTAIRVNTTTGQAFATIDNVRIENVTTSGVEAATNSFVTISRSVISRGGASASGVRANTSTSKANVQSSSVGFFDGTVINASASASLIRLSNCDIMNNGVAIAIGAGATVASDGNNRVVGFTSNTAPNAAITLQ
jgi:hypothetical protein